MPGLAQRRGRSARRWIALRAGQGSPRFNDAGVIGEVLLQCSVELRHDVAFDHCSSRPSRASRPLLALPRAFALIERTGTMFLSLMFVRLAEETTRPARLGLPSLVMHRPDGDVAQTVQSTVESPSMETKSRSRVTSVAPTAIAVAAIQRSFSSKLRPRCSRARLTPA